MFNRTKTIPSCCNYDQMSCHVTIITRKHKKTSWCIFGENFILFSFKHNSRRYCQSIIFSEHSFDPGLKSVFTHVASVYIRKEFSSRSIGLEHQHSHRFIVLEHKYGRRDVM